MVFGLVILVEDLEEEQLIFYRSICEPPFQSRPNFFPFACLGFVNEPLKVGWKLWKIVALSEGLGRDEAYKGPYNG